MKHKTCLGQLISKDLDFYLKNFIKFKTRQLMYSIKNKFEELNAIANEIGKIKIINA